MISLRSNDAPITALTDQESQHLLGEVPVELPGLDLSREGARKIQK